MAQNWPWLQQYKITEGKRTQEGASSLVNLYFLIIPTNQTIQSWSFEPNNFRKNVLIVDSSKNIQHLFRNPIATLHGWHLRNVLPKCAWMLRWLELECNCVHWERGAEEGLSGLIGYPPLASQPPTFNTNKQNENQDSNIRLRGVHFGVVCLCILILLYLS